jgi:predicted acyl esterase
VLLTDVPNRPGRLGVCGISYPRFYTSTAIIEAHTAIKAVSPQAPVDDWFIGDDVHYKGAFYLAHAFLWFSSNSRMGDDAKPNVERINFDYPTPDGLRCRSSWTLLDAERGLRRATHRIHHPPDAPSFLKAWVIDQ